MEKMRYKVETESWFLARMTMTGLRNSLTVIYVEGLGGEGSTVEKNN